MNGKKKIIRIARGQEDRSIIECIYQENLFFQNLYERARDCTNEIVNVNKQIAARWNNKHFRVEMFSSGKSAAPVSYAASRSKTKAAYYACSNFCNLIAFCADRGQGKTSAMLSYATALDNIQMSEEKSGEEKKRSFWSGTVVEKAQYEVLQSIDPTEMEPEDSILKIILSQMYVHFQTVYEQQYEEAAGGTGRYSYAGSWQEEKAIRLQEKFLHCFHLADLLNDDKCKSPPTNAEDEMEFISETGGGVNLRMVLYDLLEDYLSFVTNSDDSYLVIPIDDADLNIGRVYSMLEDIRKYLRLPRIIILMATNITQLESIVEQYFLKEYDTALRQPRSMVDVARCHHIAESYLEKILPGTRRLYLPSLYDEVKSFSGFRVSYIEQAKTYEGEDRDLLADKYAIEKVDRADQPDASQDECWNYQEQLLYLLHKKTGMVFMPLEHELYPFLPSNMRELMHLLAFLNALPDVEANYSDVVVWFRHADNWEKRHQWLENLHRFQRYLVDVWPTSNLSTESRRILTELDRYTGWEMHHYLLQILPDYYAREEAGGCFELESEEIHRQRFIDECKKHGIRTKNEGRLLNGSSYADVCVALNALENCSKEKRHQKFVCAIRLYYAIYLHRFLLENLDVERKNREPRYYTDFLRGSFLEEEAANSDLPFGLWQISLPIELLKALKGDNVWETRQWKEVCSRWFRYEEEQQNGRVIQSLDKAGDEDKPVWSFQPYYPLLETMDELTSIELKENGDSAEEVCPDTYLSLVIMLNPDVQTVIWENLKKGKTVSEQPRLFMLGELFPDLYNSGAMKRSWAILKKVNDLPVAFEGYDCFEEQRQDLGEISALIWTREFMPLGKRKALYDLERLKENIEDEQTRKEFVMDLKNIQKVFGTYANMGKMTAPDTLKHISKALTTFADPTHPISSTQIRNVTTLLEKLYGDDMPFDQKAHARKQNQKEAAARTIDNTEISKLVQALLAGMREIALTEETSKAQNNMADSSSVD